MYKEIALNMLKQEYPFLEEDSLLLDWIEDKVTYYLEEKLKKPFESNYEIQYLFWNDLYQKVKKEIEQ